MLHPEYNLQCALVSYLDAVHRHIVFCASIAGHVKMTFQQWERAKKAGYRKGFPDLMIYAPRGQYHGMVMELKSPDGKESPEQTETLSRLRAAGYYCVTVNSFESGIKNIEMYLGIKK